MTALQTSANDLVQDKPATEPVRRWAVVGAGFVAFFAYLIVRWVAAGNATENDAGQSDVPGWMSVAVWIHIVLGFIALAAVVWWFLVRPWRAERRLTSDGLFMLACLTCFWGDLASNYFRYWVVYTTAFPNLGSWYNFIPGWMPANGQLMIEATIFFLPMYAACMFAFTSIGCAAMRRMHARNPHISKLQLFLATWLLMGVVDLVLEVAWVRLGLFIYPSTVESLTLFSGNYYQFPIYESVFWGLGWAVLCAVRYFKNDRGETVVERGAHRMNTSDRRRTVSRFLALAAVANLNLLVYNVIVALIATQGGAWPRDIADRTYYTQQLCTEDTTYVCSEATDPAEVIVPVEP